jgi:hypothetical protein
LIPSYIANAQNALDFGHQVQDSVLFSGDKVKNIDDARRLRVTGSLRLLSS